MSNIKDEILKICEEKYSFEKDYVYTHLERYYQSFIYISDIIKPGFRILDIGGTNNGSTFIELLKIKFDCQIENHNKDLRYPFDGISDNKYDLILCMEVIEHIKDRESSDIAELSQFNWNGMDSLMREMFRCLKKDGYLFLTTPNANSYDCIVKILCGENPSHYSPHVKEFGYDELIKYIIQHGYKIVKSETMDSWYSGEYSISRNNIIEILRNYNLSNKNRYQNTFCICKK